MYRIEIIDTGIGIASEQLPHLFDSFSQADSGITRQYGGTGLGLAICRKIADLMGATIEVSSELGKGSRFTIHLPLPRANSNSTTQFSEDQPMTDKLIINTDQLRKMSGLMKDMFDELIPAYIDTGEKNLQAIESALTADDMKTAQRLFHSMKSSSLNVGAESLSKQAADLEARARAGQQAEVRNAMKQFKQDFAEVVEQLRQFRISA
jgi:HPt (histidine-containing phosphotransfer) domain-containing protein